MSILHSLIVLCALSLSLSLSPALSADESRGRAVAEKVDEAYAGFGTVHERSTMTLYFGDSSSERVFESYTLENDDAAKGDDNIIVFDRPADLKGVALLTLGEIEPESDKQWLYIPAMRKTKRISSSNRSGSFVSSEFSYEDMIRQEVDEFTYGWLGQEPCAGGGLTCEVYEAYPRSEASGYSKRVVRADTEEYRIRSIHFFNKRAALEKVLTLDDYEEYEPGVWRANVMEMENVQTGKRTVIEWADREFGVDLKESDFNSKKLKNMAR